MMDKQEIIRFTDDSICGAEEKLRSSDIDNAEEQIALNNSLMDLNLIKNYLYQLAEPEKVEIPKWLADKLESNHINSAPAFWRTFFMRDIFTIDNKDWILDNDDAINKIFLYGWTVKESLWVIKTPPYRDSYFKSFLEEEYAKIKINFNHTVRGKATKFTDKDKAEAVATLTGGTVEEWSE